MINTLTFVGGTDGPGFQIVIINGVPQIKPIPPWGEQLIEIRNTLGVLQRAGALKTPGIAEKVMQPLVDVIQKQLGPHMKEGGVIIAM
jgi:hypothetical protein